MLLAGQENATKTFLAATQMQRKRFRCKTGAPYIVGMTKILEKESKQLRDFVSDLFSATENQIGGVHIQRHRYANQNLFVLSNIQTDKSYLLNTVGEDKKVKSFHRMRTGEPVQGREFQEILRALQG